MQTINIQDKNTKLDLINIHEVDIIYKPNYIQTDLKKITSSKDAEKLLRNIFPSLNYVEYFYVLVLNNSNNVISWKMISMGGLTSTIVDIRVIMQTVLKCNGVSMILSHNHPSGTLKPSRQDLQLTNKIKKACKTLDLNCLDHIIITENSYYSFADDGHNMFTTE